MSQADELLDSLTEEDVTIISETEPHIVVNADRTITVPDELKKIAVQFDHNIRTVTFDCPRYYDGRDLSKMRMYINYKTPNDIFGSSQAENVTVDPDDQSIIHFDWTITRNATPAKGTLTFLLCAKNVDSEGNEENHWNSELNKEMTISEGMECSERILAQYPDVISYILEHLDTESSQVTPEYFGAKGDGITDDTESIMLALTSSQRVDFDGRKTYAISATITVPTNVYVDFHGATIVPTGNFDIIRVMPGACIENLIVKCTDVFGWDSSVMMFHAEDMFSASNPTRVNNVKLYNNMSFNDGVANAGNGFFLYADDYGQLIEGLAICNSLTCGFGRGIYIYSSVPNENEVTNAVFIGGNVFHGYWSYRDTYGVYMDARLPNNKMTNNFFTNLNVQSDYYGGSVYAVYCNGFNNYFGGCLYDYSINVSFQPNTAVYFDIGSQQNTVEVTSGGINRPEWCIDLGGRNRVIKHNDENTVNIPYSEYDNGMIGNQDDALAFIDKSCTCTLESLDSEPFSGDVSDVFTPLSAPESSLIYRTFTPDVDPCRAVITVNLKKHLRKITHFILQFGKRTPPKSVKVTLYTATYVKVIYQTKTNANRCIVISPEIDEFDFVYDVSKITVELSGFNLVTENSDGELYGEWAINRIMAVDGYNTGNTWLRRDGGEVCGNIKFMHNTGPVLTAADGKKYMLVVSTGGALSVEELQEDEDEELEVASLIPVMATGATWYNTELAGAEQGAITSVVFDANYEPSGVEDASWACDEDACGNIMAYRNGTEIVIVPTTGSDTIQINKESSGMFANDNVNASFSALASIEGTEMLVAKTGTYMLSALAGNTLITQPICIPDGVTAINKIFYNCSALQTAPVIPDSVTVLENAFLGCKALTTMPNIPMSATNLKYFVCNCSGITSVNVVVPATVKNLTGAFTNCKNMNGNIEINAANLTSYTDCFKNTSMTSGSVTLTGTCPLLAELAATNAAGKVTVATV